MNEITPKSGLSRYIDRREWKAALWFLLLIVSFAAPEATRNAVQGALSDAYIQVSSFVGMTLIIFYYLEHYLRLDVAHALKRHERWQVPLAALVGALPGCGGAIIVITQYVLGRIGFGSMVAVLTATMGDAAFLLLARAPGTALLVMAVSVVAGTATGLIVEKIHGRNFLRTKLQDFPDFRIRCGALVNYKAVTLRSWYGLLVPGIVLGGGAAFQVNTDLWFGPLAGLAPTHWIGFIGGLYCLWIWVMLPDKGFSIVNLAAHPACRTFVKNRNRIIFETSFVTTWVIVAFMAFELTMLWSGLDLAKMFDTASAFVPLLGVLVGFIPGCGPQIIVTTLYLGGLIPFSAQIGNAISNDGDALFPAIALAPKTAVLATLYTAIPALILAYALYFAGY
ncbi:MAG: arsenic efflux protein [Rhodospirillales bacterium]|nr:arsenic efflux protein [Rhodospirillales bacterium]